MYRSPLNATQLRPKMIELCFSQVIPLRLSGGTNSFFLCVFFFAFGMGQKSDILKCVRLEFRQTLGG